MSINEQWMTICPTIWRAKSRNRVTGGWHQLDLDMIGGDSTKWTCLICPDMHSLSLKGIWRCSTYVLDNHHHHHHHHHKNSHSNIHHLSSTIIMIILFHQAPKILNFLQFLRGCPLSNTSFGWAVFFQRRSSSRIGLHPVGSWLRMSMHLGIRVSWNGAPEPYAERKHRHGVKRGLPPPKKKWPTIYGCSLKA